MSDVQRWDALTRAGKIAWLWNETNSFIRDFCASLPDAPALRVAADDLFDDPACARAIFEFIGAPAASESRIERLLRRPINASRPSPRGSGRELSSAERAEVEELAPLAIELGRATGNVRSTPEKCGEGCGGIGR